MDRMVQAIKRKQLAKSEEFILNSVSCATNLLFYDTPQLNLFTTDQRQCIFSAVKPFVLETSNEELQIEAVRVISNLSRHETLCEGFVADRSFTEALVVILDHTLRELVFYTIGIIINITMHDEIKKVFVAAQPLLLPKLIDVLRDANIEDMDLSKVAAKALHNLALQGEWPNEHIKRLDEILTSLGEELDSIMVSSICISYCGGGSMTYTLLRCRMWPMTRNSRRYADCASWSTRSSMTCRSLASIALTRSVAESSRTRRSCSRTSSAGIQEARVDCVIY